MQKGAVDLKVWGRTVKTMEVSLGYKTPPPTLHTPPLSEMYGSTAAYCVFAGCMAAWLQRSNGERKIGGGE